MTKDDLGPEDDDRPMLILGEDRPDVEDNTPEQLRAQQAALEERRAQLAEQIRQERQLSQQRLDKDRREAERALAQRQREIDDAERRLARSERRLRNRAEQLGQDYQAPTPRRSGSGGISGATGDPTSRGAFRLLKGARASIDKRIPNGAPAMTLLGAGAVALLVGTLMTSGSPTESQVSTFDNNVEARGLMEQAALSMDGEVLLHSASQQLPVDDDGALLSAGLTTEAVDVYSEDFPEYYLADLDAYSSTLLATPAVSEVRVLTAWESAQQSAEYGISRSDIRAEREQLRPSVAGTILLWGGAAALLLGALVLALGRAWVAAVLTFVALVPAGFVLASDPRVGGEFVQASERHDEAMDIGRGLTSQAESDLQVAFGLRALDDNDQPSEYSPGYWGGSYRVPDPEDDPAFTSLAQARQEFGESVDSGADPAGFSEPGLRMVQEAQNAREGNAQDLDRAQSEVIAAAEGGLSTPRLLFLLLGLGLPLAGLGAELLIRRRRTS